MKLEQPLQEEICRDESQAAGLGQHTGRLVVLGSACRCTWMPGSWVSACITTIQRKAACPLTREANLSVATSKFKGCYFHCNASVVATMMEALTCAASKTPTREDSCKTLSLCRISNATNQSK